MVKNTSVALIIVIVWIFFISVVACESGNKLNDSSQYQSYDDSVAFIFSGDKMKTIRVDNASIDGQVNNEVIYIHQSK